MAHRYTCVCCGSPSGFPLQYHLLPIALAFGRVDEAKPSRGFPLQNHLLIALAFERGTTEKLSIYNQAHRLSVKRLGRVDSQFVSPLESKSGFKHTGKTPPDLYLENQILEGYAREKRAINIKD